MAQTGTFPIGKARRRVSLQAPTASKNSYGESVNSWSDVAQRWALIEPLTGRELWQAQQVQADVSHKVTVRNFPGIKSDWRVIYKGRVFNVVFVQNPEERGRIVVLYCQEGPAGAV